MDVVCESPPALRGQPVLSVSQCATGPPSHTVASASAGTSLHPLQTDAPPEYSSSHSDLSMTVISTTSPLTSSHIALLELCHPPGASGLSTVGTLVSVIGLLCVCVLVCVLVLLHRRKTRNKVATPERPTEETQQNIESSLGSSEMPEVTEKKSCGGVRAKSANAVILTSPFCVAEKDHVTVEHETDAETLKQKLETKAGETGSRRDDTERTIEGSAAAENPDRNTQSASVLYFSIGTSGRPHQRDDAGQRSLEGKAMWRISTWPATAAQWKARCESKGEEEEEKSSEEWIPPVNNTVCPSSSQWSSQQFQLNTAAQILLTETNTPAHLHQHGFVQTADVNHGQEESSIQSEQRRRPQPGVSRSATDDSNELAFRNLLHEVVQNHGRWTRERWRQMHINRQRP
ncbi:uncharacterized protein LOC114470225 isoform X2 [Gouania willdenowi]|uniref:uncharacterized protein LOC114470225 isoform X2 n=1 Tax=Gouania willdenowi TaxID=441366 RepID=UPI0010548D80|nr:uncharacterized protein LOC114470225 isoform X2 [Gouania willdenowi]